MPNSAIEVHDLRKVYTVHEREAGVVASLRSLIHRKTRDVAAVDDITFWTAAKSTGTWATSEGSIIVGGAADTWGRTWSSGDLSDATFRVRLTNVASNTSRDFSLDWVAVRVRYQP